MEIVGTLLRAYYRFNTQFKKLLKSKVMLLTWTIELPCWIRQKVQSTQALDTGVNPKLLGSRTWSMPVGAHSHSLFPVFDTKKDAASLNGGSITNRANEKVSAESNQGRSIYSSILFHTAAKDASGKQDTKPIALLHCICPATHTEVYCLFFSI